MRKSKSWDKKKDIRIFVLVQICAAAPVWSILSKVNTELPLV